MGSFWHNAGAGMMLPGKLIAWWLLFPGIIEGGCVRPDRTPWQYIWIGGVLALLAAIPTTVLPALPAGPVAKIEEQLAQPGSGSLSPGNAFVRRAIVRELAAAFLIIGWLIVFPLTAIGSLCAVDFGVLPRMPPAAELVDQQAVVG